MDTKILFPTNEISYLDNLPHKARRIYWILIFISIVGLIISFYLFYSVVNIGHLYGNLNYKDVLILWRTDLLFPSGDRSYKGYEIYIYVYLLFSFMIFSIPFVALLMILPDHNRKNKLLTTCWSLLKLKENNHKMDLEKHFNKKQIRTLNDWEKYVNIMKYALIIATIMGVVINTLVILLCFYLALSNEHNYGVKGVQNVISLWYSSINLNGDYQGNEYKIIRYIANAHLCLFTAIALIILFFLSKYNLKDRCLIKCWDLLNSKSENMGNLKNS